MSQENRQQQLPIVFPDGQETQLEEVTPERITEIVRSRLGSARFMVYDQEGNPLAPEDLGSPTVRRLYVEEYNEAKAPIREIRDEKRNEVWYIDTKTGEEVNPFEDEETFVCPSCGEEYSENSLPDRCAVCGEPLAELDDHDDLIW